MGRVSIGNGQACQPRALKGRRDPEPSGNPASLSALPPPRNQEKMASDY